MGSLNVTEFLTLDRLALAPGRSRRNRENGFANGGWQAPLADEQSGDAIFEQAKRMDALRSRQW